MAHVGVGLYGPEWSDGSLSSVRQINESPLRLCQKKKEKQCAIFYILFVSSGLSSVSANNKEYHYVSLRKTWTDAQSYCREKFIDLVTINDANDNQRPLTLVQNSHESTHIWIGLYDNISIWKWSNENEQF